MTRQRRCRICHERPPWHGKNCPPGICKRCYHREIWVDRPAARRERHEAERAASTDPLADFAGPLVYDGYLDAFRPADCSAAWVASRRPLVAYEAAIERTENAVQRASLRRKRDQLSGRAACAALPD